MSINFKRGPQNNIVFGKIESLPKLTKIGLRRGMFKAGHGLIAEANREILKGNKSGVTYLRRTKSGRRRRHKASAPGETHANISGTLRKSLSFQLRGTSEIEYGYGVSSGKDAPDYAKFVEFGTTRMKARPSLKNSLTAERGNMTQHFGGGIMRVIK